MTEDFTGFSPALFGFLGQLSANNERDWFQANKQSYEDDVREPARAFIRSMGPRLEDITDHYVASDKKVGGSLMRIFRDVRFGADKTPYKTNVGMHFKHSAGKDVHAPGFYVHISLEECFLGVGIWRPDGPSLKAIRDRIVEKPEQWEEIISAPTFTSHFELSGDALKRPPRGYDKEHPLVEHLKRKDHIAMATLDSAEVLDPQLLDRVMERFEAAAPYCRFLSEAVGLAF
jgi:uncharacterized protein (TIGR02453 family)